MRINAGRFVVTAELLTVNAGGVAAVQRRFEPYEAYVDATNATDNTSAHAHASPLAVAIALNQLGMEPVMQLTCRDRNRLALEADIAGAALHGIENICCLTGDDVTAGDEPEARRVFDLDSIQLLALGASMTQGTYLSGRKLEPAPKLFLGAVENPGAPPYDYRVERAWKKVRAGARFLQLQVELRARAPRRLHARSGRQGARDRVRAHPVDLPRARAERAPVHGRARAGDHGARGDDRALRARARPRAGVLRRRLRARRACALAARASRTALISFRKEAGIARLCQRLNIPTREERELSGYRRPVAV